MDSTTIYSNVLSRYSATANASENAQYGHSVAQAFGYSAEELASIPTESNLGLSCGNPIALANLNKGETVIDLGCGAGFDVFLAARKVGPQGKVIGIDMNADMLAKAQRNAEKASIKNVEFVSSKITKLPIDDASVDVVISNCVINLVPHNEKHHVFKEIYRVLKPGGRVAVSDILAKKSLPEQMKNDVALYVGCVAGASRKEEYEGWLREAGFKETLIVDANADLNVYTQGDVGSMCCGPVSAEKDETAEKKASSCCGPVKPVENNKPEGSCCGGAKKSDRDDGGVVMDMTTNFKDVDLNEWAGSYKIFAIKT